MLSRPSSRFLSTKRGPGPAVKKLIAIGEKWKPKTTRGLPKQDTPNSGSKYILCQFPYPSGALHIGHLRVYVISDSLNRFYKQKGYNVIHPMGWDAFGLPAENAAIERSINPAIWTRDNIAKMKQQMQSMLANFDWDREITTCDPEYYKFTQWIFLKLFENGLAYRKEAEINWDPVDMTVLANEQVDAQGRSWRSGAIVEKKQLKQWFLGITKFAPKLKKHLNQLKDWPSNVKQMQKNWIGESVGAELVFKVVDPKFENLIVFTTRPETLFAVQYVALALDHPIVQKYCEEMPDLKEFIQKSDQLPNDTKEGFQLPNIKAVNPLTKEEVPIFAAPYVVSSYGSAPSAVMGCPGHDNRDFEFWQTNCPGEHIKTCIAPFFDDASKVSEQERQRIIDTVPFTSTDGVLTKECGEHSGVFTAMARKSIMGMLKSEGLSKSVVRYKIRDWLISRQRYWGTPIPIIHCDNCGPVPVPESDLPVKLPELEGLDTKGNPLSTIDEFVNVACPSCGSPAKRETDTMDTFIDSSWYYFRFLDSKNTSKPFDREIASKNMPVDIYIGGVEHAILHLLYSRFIAKLLGSINAWSDPAGIFEPFKKLVTQGMVQGKTYVDPDSGKFLKPDELTFVNDSPDGNTVIIKSNGKVPVVSYEKMSKSKYNGADPNECILRHGPDATRAHILFQSPIADALNWDESKIVGIERWLQKVLHLTKNILSLEKDLAISKDYKTPTDLNDAEVKFHNDFQRFLKSITESFEINLSLNTVISDYMKLTNILESALKKGEVRNEMIVQNLQKLVTVMYPAVPSISEEAAEMINSQMEWNQYRWPEVERTTESKFKKFQIVVNGRVKFMYTADKNFLKLGRDAVVETLMNLPEGRMYLMNKKIKKIVMKFNVISFLFHK
ncbi:AMH_1a_G0037960.mRNA.1.CDS.1 [Saccharomyces cerevisiae]|nr:EM14S01-3B_G0039690.mRNA.1.CDS.1 [Saccharomyces cerevisiae]CAI4702134.1 AMH_1a_G0037960.mRNA.1.CDS.1 [Saccharomyces cerevisiae]CAI6844495.1 AMH_1a_G0037960.mRNA.1.CDS.1 [Saccharomyces cerevisiae]